MTVLLMRLAGPLQAWGASSRYVRRTTNAAPTKSGIVGMLAAATGRRRTDPIEDLVALRFAVRTDQPGQLLRDFQTQRSLDGLHAFPLSERYYLSDAVFVAGIEGEEELVRGLGGALRRPAYPVYLGRRSCVPSRPVVIGLDEENPLTQAIEKVPWQAATWWKAKAEAGTVELPLSWDAEAPGDGTEVSRDVPLSFDPERREYGWRDVAHGVVRLDEEAAARPQRVQRRPRELSTHDPFALLSGD